MELTKTQLIVNICKLVPEYEQFKGKLWTRDLETLRKLYEKVKKGKK